MSPHRGSPLLVRLLIGLVLLGSAGLTALLLTRGPDSAVTAAAPAAQSPSPTPTEAPREPAPSMPTPEGATPAPAPTASALRPAAVGVGAPDCGGPCIVENRLTRSFLASTSGEQTLLLARSETPDELNSLYAFLVDDLGRVIWSEKGFGFEFLPVDDRFRIRFDEAGHTFFRVFVADMTYVYVLDTNGPTPRLLGAGDRDPLQGFVNGEVLERPGQDAFAIRESFLACGPGQDVAEDFCPEQTTTYEWTGQEYAAR